MRFFNKRNFLIAGLIVATVAIAAIGGVLVYISSPEFKEKARQYAVREIEKDTGGHVTIGKLYWNLWNQKVSFFDITFRGTEPSQGLPLAHIESIDAGVSIRSLIKRQIDLFNLTVTRPVFHLYVDEMGNTNLPSPPPRDLTGLANFQLSIESVKIAQGEAFVNERQFDLDFLLKNLSSEFSYKDSTHNLAAHLAYEGVVQPEHQTPFTYSLNSEFEYSLGTLYASRVILSSGNSQLRLQGRITDVLTSQIAGKLDYTGTAALPILNYFFPAETFAGRPSLTGTLEFASGSFRTHGAVKSESIGFDRWNATNLQGDYDYRYPEKSLSVERISAGVFGGNVGGMIKVESLPGVPRVQLNLTFADIDGVSMAGEFPWDAKYRLESQISGMLQGWFEGRLDRFDINGNAALSAVNHKSESGVLSLPVDGTLTFAVQPGIATVTHGNFHLFSTSIVADGSVGMENLNLKVQMASSDLRNLSFLYADANGTGSFEGVLTGPIKKPQVQGSFDLRKYKYRDWTIEHAAGLARLDTSTNAATLTDVQVVQGKSEITVNGTSALDGSKVNLRIQSTEVRAADVEPFVKQPLAGIFSGSIHLTSINPMRFEGDVRAASLVLKGQSLRELQSHIQYDDPVVTLQNLSVADSGSTLTGKATYNPTSEAVTFDVQIGSVDLQRLREFGMPDSVEGRIQQAHLTGSGTRTHPEVNGTAQLRNLAFHGESFPTASVDIDTAGSQVSVRLFDTGNLDINARINTAGTGYPFTARANFTRYSIERLAGFRRGTLTVSGNADLAGSLNDIGHVSGTGQINPLEIGIANEPIHSTKPFSFSFNSEQLKLLDDVALVSAGGTEFVMNGTVGLTSSARLDLTLAGKFGAGLLISDKAWTVTGLLDVTGRIRGTVSNPDLQGQASFSDLGIARQGVALSLAGLRGSVLFDERRINLTNVEGRTNGGTVTFSGTATLDGTTIGTLNVRVTPMGVRVRYPTGMRSVVNGSLIVGGTLTSPSVSGDLQIQSLNFNNSFEEFLTLFETPGSGEPSPFGNLQLSLRLTGSRNISIQNELASAEARVDLAIKGTIDNPALTGRVETNKGTLLFQGKKYDVTRGNIDFVDPVRIDPVIDIQAETSIRNYLVYLSITGRVEHFQLSMRSEPPLPQLEIVNLISGGKTTDEFGETSRASLTPTGEQVFQGGAASILSDMLVSRVGSKLSLLGLDRNSVRIDPFVVGAQNSTTARITLSKQVTKELSVTYSQDLASNKQQIIQIEYFITKNISVLASKDENNEHALDLRIRKRF